MRARILMALLGSFALTLPGAAQDEAAEPSADNPAPPPAEESDDGDGDEAADEEDIDEEFIFSEEIPADTQLVFPVDI